MPVENGAWVPSRVDAPHAPDATFPGATAAITDAAFPSGHQPAVLGAWPVNATTTTIEACWKTSVLDDTTTGWAGECSGLTQALNPPVLTAGATTSITQAQCEALCVTDPYCSTWQFNTDNGTMPNTTSCWTGKGFHCYQVSAHGITPDTNSVTAAQRIQHGEVRVLKNMQAYEVLNLYHLGAFQTGTTSGGAVERCRDWCYSSVTCTYWSYGSDGCRVEHPDGNTAAAGDPPNTVAMFPLLTAGVAQNNSYTLGLIGAEYIQHYCPPVPDHSGAAPALDPAATASGTCQDGYNLPIIGCTSSLRLLLGLLAVLLIIGLIWYFCCRKKAKKASKSKEPAPKTRGVKPKPAVAAKPAPAPPVAPAPPPSDMREVAPTPSQEPLLPQAAPPQYVYQQPVQYAQQSFAVPNYMPMQQSFLAQQYQYSPVSQANVQGSVAASAAPSSNLPPVASQFKVGDRVHVWSRNNNAWHPDGQVAAVDEQGWHVRYDANQTQKVVLFADAQNLQKF